MPEKALLSLSLFYQSNIQICLNEQKLQSNETYLMT